MFYMKYEMLFVNKRLLDQNPVMDPWEERKGGGGDNQLL